MDLRLTEEQQLIRDTARGVLATRCAPTVVRAMERDPRGFPPALWGHLAELGWLGAAFPEAHGGGGQPFLDLCILIEEQGRARMPGPFVPTVVSCGLPIARFGTAAQQARCLPAIAAGQRILTYADAEPGRAGWGAPVETVAVRGGGGWVLDGAKLFVPFAHVADELLIAARTHERGLTMFLVDAKAAGITVEPLETLGADHQGAVQLRGVRVADDGVLGRIDDGAEVVQAIREWSAAATCAEMVGGAERVLEMTVDYAKTRTQFGSPIGAFQAVQHHCANMAVAVDGARFLAYEAIWRLSEGLDATTEVSMAKAWVSDAYQRVCALGHQVHGAIGYTREHDLQLYFRHARATELAFGDAAYHTELVARRLGL